MKPLVAWVLAVAVLGCGSWASADVKTTTSTSYQLVDGVMTMTGGGKTVTMTAPGRTETVSYRVDERGEHPQSRSVTRREQSDNESMTSTTTEKYDESKKLFVTTGRTTSISRMGATESTIESVVDGQLVPVRRTVTTARNLPGLVDTLTITEEHQDGALIETREVRVHRIDFASLPPNQRPAGDGLQYVRLAGHGVQTITTTRTLVNGTLTVTSVYSQVSR